MICPYVGHDHGISVSDSVVFGMASFSFSLFSIQQNIVCLLVRFGSELCFKAVPGRGQPRLMRWISLWIMPLEQDRGPN